MPSRQLRPCSRRGVLDTTASLLLIQITLQDESESFRPCATRLLVPVYWFASED